jgi:hypothetical protein
MMRMSKEGLTELTIFIACTVTVVALLYFTV